MVSAISMSAVHDGPVMITAAGAQPVYRCGSSYGQQPCPGGTPVAADDSRTPAEAA